MSKKSELPQVLDELAACAEGLARTLRALGGILVPERLEAESPGGAPVGTTAEDAPGKYTFPDVRKAFSAKAREGHTAEIKALIASYGADKLSDVKDEDYPALMASLEAIG